MQIADSPSTASVPTGVDERVAAIFEKHRRRHRLLMFSGVVLFALVGVMFLVGAFIELHWRDGAYHTVGLVILISALAMWGVFIIVAMIVGAATAKCPVCGDLMQAYPYGKFCPLCSAKFVLRGFFFARCNVCRGSLWRMALLDITFCPVCGKRLR